MSRSSVSTNCENAVNKNPSFPKRVSHLAHTLRLIFIKGDSMHVDIERLQVFPPLPNGSRTRLIANPSI